MYLINRQKGLPARALLRQMQAGQTLLEILLAFSVSILVLSAVIMGIVTSLSNTQYTKNQGLANSYAQEGMAVIRKIRDSSWNTYEKLDDVTTTNTIYCLGPDSTDLDDDDKLAAGSNCKTQNPVAEIFSREVKFEHQSPSCCPDDSQNCVPEVRGSKATVIASWADSKCPIGAPLCHKVELITCFSSVDRKFSP